MTQDREAYWHENVRLDGQNAELRAEIARLRREIGILKALLAQYEKP
jgi:cell division protein FtsB